MDSINLLLQDLIVVVVLALVPLVLAVGISLVYSIITLDKELETAAYEKLAASAQVVDTWYQDSINSGNVSVDPSKAEDVELIDSLVPYGVELTLFQGDTRIMTSIKDPSNSTGRNIGTQASAEIYARVKAGERVEQSGVVINGSKYYVCYLPIKDASGNFWGMAACICLIY